MISTQSTNPESERVGIPEHHIGVVRFPQVSDTVVESREVGRDGCDSLKTTSQHRFRTTKVGRTYIAEPQSHQAHSSELERPRAYQEDGELKASVIIVNLAHKRYRALTGNGASL